MRILNTQYPRCLIPSSPLNKRHIMKSKLIKSVSGLVIFSCFFGITSCSGKDNPFDSDHILNSPKYICENDEWWDISEFSIVSDELSFDIESPDVVVNGYIRGITDNGLYISWYGFEFVQNDTRTINELLCYSLNNGEEGTVVGNIDFSDYLDPEEGFINDISAIYEEDSIDKAIVQIQYLDSRGLKNCVCNIDLVNCKIGDLEELIFDVNSDDTIITVNDIICTDKSVFLKCHLSNDFEDEDGLFVLANNECTRIRMSNIEYIGKIVGCQDNNLAMQVTAFGKNAYMLLETDSMTLSEIPALCGDTTIDSTCLVTCNMAGENEVVLDFNNTFLSSWVYRNAEIISSKNDRVVMKYNNTVVVLDKSDINPNSGKQIIEVAHVDYLNPMTSYGISEFNKKSDEYFVIDTDKYNYWSVFDWDAAMDDYYSEYLRASSEMTSALMMDISSGEGPDVILNGSDYRELQNDAFLMNIDSLIDGLNLSEEDYFMSIINSARTNEKTYVLPLDTNVIGMVLKEKDAQGLDSGIKIENYPKFVKDVCNGNDPLYMYGNKMAYFIQLVGETFDLYIDKDGNVDFDNPYFRIIAEYVYKNVPDEIVGTENMPNNLSGITNDFSRFSLTLATRKLVGHPSPDGRGACYRFVSSGSITSCSSCKEGSWKFLLALLDESIQKLSDQIPVSKEAFLDGAVTYDGSPINQEIIDNYITLVNSGSSYYSMDYMINTIVKEEMQGYFCGQKNLDDVIGILNSRVGIMVAERK